MSGFNDEQLEALEQASFGVFAELVAEKVDELLKAGGIGPTGGVTIRAEGEVPLTIYRDADIVPFNIHPHIDLTNVTTVAELVAVLVDLGLGTLD